MPNHIVLLPTAVHSSQAADLRSFENGKRAPERADREEPAELSRLASNLLLLCGVRTRLIEFQTSSRNNRVQVWFNVRTWLWQWSVHKWMFESGRQTILVSFDITVLAALLLRTNNRTRHGMVIKAHASAHSAAAFDQRVMINCTRDSLERLLRGRSLLLTSKSQEQSSPRADD